MKTTHFDRAVSTLEFDKIAGMLADCARTEGAKAQALRLYPDYDIDRIRRRLSQTSDAKALVAIKGMPSFGNIKDITASLERAEKGAILTPRELLDITAVLNTAKRLTDYYNANRRDTTPGRALAENFGRLETDIRLENRITKAILAEDMIADEASPALADIRRRIRAENNKIKDSLQKYVGSGAYSKFLQENIVTMRNGRYVIPVKAEYKNEIKGLVHDTSASGATFFIEPLSVIEANNELKSLESKEEHEIERILAELSAACAEQSSLLSLNYHNITELDFIFAKAELSYKLDASEPKINEKKYVYLHRARHPLIDKKTVVPITVSVGGAYDTIVITGPNTGGKTVSLKTLGLFALMAQSGLHIPCESDSELCVFDAVLADIGDEQSIEQSLSTFSSHMVNIVEILKVADDRSLVLFDELGAGTDPTEGASLAISILEKIRSSGALCAATTHYSELKAYALETGRVTNASCEFDVETLKPTYRLIIGTPGKSNAFEISRKLGIGDDIIENAKSRLSSDSKRFEYVIEQLEKNRIEAEREREEAAKMRREYEAFRNNEEKKLRQKIEAAERELEKSRSKAIQLIDGAKITSEYVLNQLEEVKRRQDSASLAESLENARLNIRKKLREADNDINPVNENIDEDYVLPRPLKKGDEVLITDINKQGTVTDISEKDGTASVKTGLISMRTSIKNLKLIEEAATVTTADKKRIPASGYRATPNKNFSPSLDLRGQNGDDGWFMTDKYLDDARVANIHTVTLIHGKGTGALRTALHRYLKADSRVKSFRIGLYGEGDSGVTVVELK